MRAGLRFTTILLAGGLGLASAALAQNTIEPPTTNAPASDAIGPRELQNFSLPGTTTRPAEQQPAPVTTAPASGGVPSAARSTPRNAPPPTQRATTRAASNATPTPVVQSPATAQTAAQFPTSPPTEALLPDRSAGASVQQTPAGPPVAQSARPAGTLEPQHTLLLWPWIAAALALAGATAFLLWRRRPREAYAGGAEFDLFQPPEPAPAPRPQPAPRLPPAPRAPASPPASTSPAPAPRAAGIVASRLRPSLDIGVQPLRCLIADDQVTIDFELELHNAGTAPARSVIAEARLFNAGANQEQELAAFFAVPVGAGSGLEAIPPLNRIVLTSQVIAPRNAIQEYELAGRRSFVPVIAFNALYEWSGGKAQTSAAFLIGHETGGEKLGPLRLDRGAREVRRLAARPLPAALRT